MFNKNILFRCCGGTSTIVSIHNALYAGIINNIGTNAQKTKFLSNFINSNIVGCFALSEPGDKNKIIILF